MNPFRRMSMAPALPSETQTLMHSEAAEAADVVAAQFARNRGTISALAAGRR